MPITAWVAQVACLGAGLFALIMITGRVTGRARTVGQLGSVAIMLGVLTTILTSFLTAIAIDRSGYQVSYLAQSIGYLIRTVLFGGGLLLLARCIVLNHRQASSSAADFPYGQGRPYGQSGPYGQYRPGNE